MKIKTESGKVGKWEGGRLFLFLLTGTLSHLLTFSLPAPVGPPGVFIPGGGLSSNAVYAMIINYGTAGTNAAVGVAAGSGITVLTNGSVRTVALYAPPVISSFVNNRNTVEVGTTITATTLDWVLGGAAITSQSLDNGIPAQGLGDRTYTHTSTYTTDRTYVLTVSDGVTSPTASTSISFRHKAYWGVTNLTSLNDAQIIGLATAGTAEFATARQRTKTLTPAVQYIYFAYPSSMEAATFFMNGLLNTAWTLVTREFVNASGDPEEYHIYRSNNLLDATYEVEIQ